MLSLGVTGFDNSRVIWGGCVTNSSGNVLVECFLITLSVDFTLMILSGFESVLQGAAVWLVSNPACNN